MRVDFLDRGTVEISDGSYDCTHFTALQSLRPRMWARADLAPRNERETCCLANRRLIADVQPRLVWFCVLHLLHNVSGRNLGVILGTRLSLTRRRSVDDNTTTLTPGALQMPLDCDDYHERNSIPGQAFRLHYYYQGCEYFRKGADVPGCSCHAPVLAAAACWGYTVLWRSKCTFNLPPLFCPFFDFAPLFKWTYGAPPLISQFSRWSIKVAEGGLFRPSYPKKKARDHVRGNVGGDLDGRKLNRARRNGRKAVQISEATPSQTRYRWTRLNPASRGLAW
ncbi:hypothetical protein C8R47DRAFT_1081308 [Mycena vitilis]|nr:hypothetical protein C8R47DRAFT_1081308 [Mycena vitilis]